MKIIDEIADYLEDESIGTVGTDIFTGELPFDGNAIISLVSSPSPEPNKSIPYYRQYVDVWARFADYDDGVSKLQAVMDLLHQKEHYELPNFHVYLSYALGMIEDFDRDTERRHIFKLSLAFLYRNASEIS